ncbi:GNAT family N-acetyltransferase [Ciceribacter sp. RN22]|uniref:GNAT family N-acetyltransferase n=1 Tax=Ciceribacter sp. RN22 TaxID=2954932 RepID=UPI0027E2CB1E|nr:GNAT family N-acetyltransferase [Ciceribacter sp. RN22]
MVRRVLIRPMTEADAESVGEVGFAAWAANRILNDFGTEMPERVHRAFCDFAATGSPVILVAECEGEIVGWTARDGGPDYVSDLWVRPDHQGKGAGRALLEHVFSLMRSEGIERARIATHARNIGAIRLYERCGFVLIWRGMERSEAMQMDVEKVHLEKAL